MTKPFSFKLWNTKTQRFSVDQNLYYLRIDGKVIADSTGESVDHIEVVWDTGLLDANKNEIYEGDLVEYDGREGVATVKWDEEDGSFYLHGSNLGWLDLFSDSRRWWRCEVVGNVFENPALIQKSFDNRNSVEECAERESCYPILDTRNFGPS